MSPLSAESKQQLLDMVDHWLDRQLGQEVELGVEQGMKAVPNNAEGCDNGREAGPRA
ncbi:MAG: hypothetical protein ABFD60_01710 [Bryobacteraceae bacterium]